MSQQNFKRILSGALSLALVFYSIPSHSSAADLFTNNPIGSSRQSGTSFNPQPTSNSSNPEAPPVSGSGGQITDNYTDFFTSRNSGGIGPTTGDSASGTSGFADAGNNGGTFANTNNTLGGGSGTEAGTNSTGTGSLDGSNVLNNTAGLVGGASGTGGTVADSSGAGSNLAGGDAVASTGGYGNGTFVTGTNSEAGPVLVPEGSQTRQGSLFASNAGTTAGSTRQMLNAGFEVTVSGTIAVDGYQYNRADVENILSGALLRGDLSNDVHSRIDGVLTEMDRQDINVDAGNNRLDHLSRELIYEISSLIDLVGRYQLAPDPSGPASGNPAAELTGNPSVAAIGTAVTGNSGSNPAVDYFISGMTGFDDLYAPPVGEMSGFGLSGAEEGMENTFVGLDRESNTYRRQESTLVTVSSGSYQIQGSQQDDVYTPVDYHWTGDITEIENTTLTGTGNTYDVVATMDHAVTTKFETGFEGGSRTDGTLYVAASSPTTGLGVYDDQTTVYDLGVDLFSGTEFREVEIVGATSTGGFDADQYRIDSTTVYQQAGTQQAGELYNRGQGSNDTLVQRGSNGIATVVSVSNDDIYNRLQNATVEQARYLGNDDFTITDTDLIVGNPPSTVGNTTTTVGNATPTIGNTSAPTGNATATVGDDYFTVGNSHSTLTNNNSAIGNVDILLNTPDRSTRSGDLAAEAVVRGDSFLVDGISTFDSDWIFDYDPNVNTADAAGNVSVPISGVDNASVSADLTAGQKNVQGRGQEDLFDKILDMGEKALQGLGFFIDDHSSDPNESGLHPSDMRNGTLSNGSVSNLQDIVRDEMEVFREDYLQGAMEKVKDRQDQASGLTEFFSILREELNRWHKQDEDLDEAGQGLPDYQKAPPPPREFLSPEEIAFVQRGIEMKGVKDLLPEGSVGETPFIIEKFDGADFILTAATYPELFFALLDYADDGEVLMIKLLIDKDVTEMSRFINSSNNFNPLLLLILKTLATQDKQRVQRFYAALAKRKAMNMLAQEAKKRGFQVVLRYNGQSLNGIFSVPPLMEGFEGKYELLVTRPANGTQQTALAQTAVKLS